MNEKLAVLRNKHPRFVYRNYHIHDEAHHLTMTFEFLIEPDIVFQPTITLPGITPAVREACPPHVIENLAFHLGMVEIPSYWKATCSPEVVIEAGPLSVSQQEWWQALLINGMTEFYFVNQIDFTAPDFVTIRAAEHSGPEYGVCDVRALSQNRVLVPVGGGKDSVVTIELLKQLPVEIACLSLNPMPAANDIIALSGCCASHVITRTLDQKLLQLNAEGYLNGHTPYSSLIAMISVTCATIFGYGQVIMSYERSSNEGNTIFCGKEINHQYSKSFDFEQRFRSYAANYLTPGITFFSLLRPWYELQIAQRFAQLKAYHAVFRSCNRGLKSNMWCGNCPKCLFVYTALYPFLDTTAMEHIFGSDLFAKEELVPIALQLLKPDLEKPFECVGMREENIVAFYLSYQKVLDTQEIPPLLQIVQQEVLQHERNLPKRADAVLAGWNDAHALPQNMIALLQQELSFQ